MKEFQKSAFYLTAEEYKTMKSTIDFSKYRAIPYGKAGFNFYIKKVEASV